MSEQTHNLQKTPRDASRFTREVNETFRTSLPFDQQDDFADAKRGFIATISEGAIQGPHGYPAWDLAPYHFLEHAEGSATVNPSLWRQAQLNSIHGLFKVTERVYQVRGLDTANMTIIEGETGLIIIDPLVSTECASAALDLYLQHVAQKPVVAVLYTHPHVDHFGGVRGVINEEEVKAGNIPILAPEGFLEYAISENVFAGNAMSRRGQYQFGALLPKGEQGQVDTGLAKGVSTGTVSLIPPTETIKATGERRTIDGVEMVFQMAWETEAPVEFLIYFPQFRALCAAEDMTHTQHNLYTPRGAQVRNAVAWWKTINKAIECFGDQTEVIFAQHHWPIWGQARIRTFMEKQRDLYKYVHDQTLRLLNHGYTMLEVAEMIQLPASLANEWYNRGYYGTVINNAKGVYQRYLGFYSSHPADLHPWPPEEVARRYVDFMGGTTAVLEKARASFEQGDYRWVAEVLKHVVFSDPSNEEARAFQAEALE